jgi:hypothetical protein
VTFFFAASSSCGELIYFRRIFAEKFRVGEQAFDARHLGLDGVDLRLDAFEFAGFLEGQFARLVCRRGGFAGERR